MMAEPNVRVETVELDSSGARQIKPRGRTTALLRDRADDIEAAVQEASAIVQESVAKVQDKDGWRTKSVEVKFGLVLTAEAGVVLSRASAEASFEVTLTIERGLPAARWAGPSRTGCTLAGAATGSVRDSC